MYKIGYGCIIILCVLSFLIAIKYWNQEKVVGIIQFIISTVLTLVTIGTQIWPQKAVDLIPRFSKLEEENEKLKYEIDSYELQIDNLKIEVGELNEEIKDLTNELKINGNDTEKSSSNLKQKTDNDFVDIATLHPLVGYIDVFLVMQIG